MKTVWLSLVALGLVAGCSSSSPSKDLPIDELSARAAQITDQLTMNDWSTVREDFDDTMSEKLSEGLLQTAWDQVVRAKGAYQSRGEPSQIPKPGDFVVFDTPMNFEEGAMKSRVTFHPDGRIAGLFLLEPEAL